MPNKIRHDWGITRIRLLATAVFALCIILGSLRASGNRGGRADCADYADYADFLLIGSAVVASVVIWWPFPYRCPRCRKRLKRIEERRPEYHYYCDVCNVEWNTHRTDDSE